MLLRSPTSASSRARGASPRSCRSCPTIPRFPITGARGRRWRGSSGRSSPQFTDSDPVTAGQHLRFQQEVPGALDQPHTTIKAAGHFVQEDAGDELARITLDLIARTPAAS